MDLGFEQAGWESTWQIELDDVNRAVLADRFPGARQFKNLNDWRSYKLPRVRCIGFGSPCQDISQMGGSGGGSRPGLYGGRSGLFFECMQIVRALQPDWVVFENVAALLFSNGGRDFERVLQEFAQCGYLGFGRVLNAQYFGVPQKRRRFFLVAGLGRHPSVEFISDAGTVEAVSCSLASQQVRQGNQWAGYALTAPDKYQGGSSGRINLGSEVLIAEEDGWDQMVERGREVELHGFPSGLDAADAEEAYAAGNAVCPPVAKWIAEILNRS